MYTTRRKTRKNSFYLLMGILGLIAVFLGFLTTYIVPSVKGSFKAPLVIHIHGALALGWISLLFIQAMTIKFNRFPLHKTLGVCGAFIALGIIGTMLPVGLVQVERELSLGLGATAISSLVGLSATALIFGGFVILGFVYRRKPAFHKRFMLLATIVLLWPAWFRFRHYFPSVPRPDIWFGVVLADSLIILAWIADKVTYGKIHPALLYGGLFIILENTLEVLMFDSSPWRTVSQAIYHAIT